MKRQFSLLGNFKLAVAMMVLLFGVGQAQAQGLPVKCPVDGKFYQIRFPDNFSDARSVAQNAFWEGRRGQLAVLNRDDVRAWVFNEFRSRNPGFVFVGGQREGNVATRGWYWFDNVNIRTPIAMGSNWAPGEPNNFAGRESVASLDFNQGGRLNDISPNGRYRFLVQY